MATRHYAWWLNYGNYRLYVCEYLFIDDYDTWFISLTKRTKDVTFSGPSG